MSQSSARPLSPSNQTSATVQYFYFFRFPIILWLTLFALAFLDSFTSVSALTRGIFTPSVISAFGAADFFTVSLGMVCLLTARVICIEGAARFVINPPLWLRRSLGDHSEQWAWRTLIFAQLPSLYVMYRYHQNAHIEKVVSGARQSLLEVLWTLIGIAGALLFWRFVNDFYYWASCLRLHPTPAPTLLWPHHRGQSALGQNPSEWPWPLRPLHRLFDAVSTFGPGYEDEHGQLFGTHQFVIVGALSLFTLYLVLALLTAPIEHLQLTRTIFALVAVGALVIAASLFASKADARTPNSILFSFSAMGLIAIVALIVTFTARHGGLWWPDFPVISAVAILLSVLAFLFSGLSFYADRHRIPVFTSIVVILGALQGVSHLGFSGEHYFEPVLLQSSPTPVSPFDAYSNYRARVCSGQASCPIIIITATGGGIQASAWTQTVLSQLEVDVARRCLPFSFHDHVLLLSAVSGGSVGSLPFLREYYAKHPFDMTNLASTSHPGLGHVRPCMQPPDRDATLYDPVWKGQGNRAAYCSSLGGVGWGLQYADLLRLVTPFLPGQTRLTDRSQALEQTLARNLTSTHCDPTYGPDTIANEPVSRLTLARMMADLGSGADHQHPAFSFNTTVAESGGRFLLSNYENDPNRAREYGVPAAASWLDTYARTDRFPLDMNFATAARLSATFPYISSAARVRSDHLEKAQHFLDGGYFDNDGTATAIEFLQQLFPPSPSAASLSQPNLSTTGGSAAPNQILFIEIRDGADISENLSDERLDLASESDKSWNPGSQLLAPVLGFWRAGHSSVTRRNRRELNLLMQDLESRKIANFHHIVFDYQKPVQKRQGERQSIAEGRSKVGEDPTRHEAADPLSWHLTPQQKDDILTSMKTMDFCVARVIKWVEQPDSNANQYLPHAGRVECNRELSINYARDHNTDHP